MINNVLIIIRSADERTEKLCKKLILEQGVPEEQVVVVREAPFSVAMHKSFELGLKSGYKYTFCVDADVLLRAGSIIYMIDQFECQPENVCEIQGSVLDKFFGGPRPGGTHVYRSSFLPAVIKRIPEEGVDIRPEYHTLRAMAADGFPWIRIPYVLGTHDDEQYNFDIYRKCFVHAVKHVHLADLFSEVWKAKVEKDTDFEVALRAFADGFQYRDALFIDKNQTIYKESFAKTSFDEKEELDISGVDLSTIENRMLSWEDHPMYVSKFPKRFGLKDVETDPVNNQNIGWFQRVKFRLAEKGILKFIAAVVAKVLLIIGERIKKLSD
jgi:hypothetical protein